MDVCVVVVIINCCYHAVLKICHCSGLTLFLPLYLAQFTCRFLQNALHFFPIGNPTQPHPHETHPLLQIMEYAGNPWCFRQPWSTLGTAGWLINQDMAGLVRTVAYTLSYLRHNVSGVLKPFKCQKQGRDTALRNPGQGGAQKPNPPCMF